MDPNEYDLEYQIKTGEKRNELDLDFFLHNTMRFLERGNRRVDV